jgi:hypothetical protein
LIEEDVMSHALRRSLCITAIAFVSSAVHPAQAGHSAASFGVEFEGCVESIGVALAPIAGVLALMPPGFIPVGLGGPVSPIVVRTADCAGIAVDGGKSKPGSVVQIGAVIVPPDGAGDINNYTFWYYTTSEKLAHRLQDLGVAAQHVANVGYHLDAENHLSISVKRPGDPRFVISGTVVPSVVPAGSFEAIWWQKTAAGNAWMDTKVPVIAIGWADLALATDADGALGMLIGGGAIDFWILQQFNVLPSAQMDVTVVH